MNEERKVIQYQYKVFVAIAYFALLDCARGWPAQTACVVFYSYVYVYGIWIVLVWVGHPGKKQSSLNTQYVSPIQMTKIRTQFY